MSKTITLKKSTSLNKPATAEQQMSNTSDFSESCFEPNKNVIENILNYSKALSIRKSKNIEFIETVLN